MKEEEEEKEIRKLFNNGDYEPVHFLLKDNDYLQEKLEYEYAVSTIETKRKTGSIKSKIEVIAGALKNSGFNHKVLEWALYAVRDELIVEFELLDRSRFYIYYSEVKGIPVQKRDDMALMGYTCLLLYYNIVKSEFEKKGAIQLFFLHAFSSVEVFKLISSEKYEKAALFLSQFIYTKGSIEKIMELTELKCNNLSPAMYIALLRFYLYILEKQQKLFGNKLLEYFKNEGLKCFEITEQLKNKLYNGEWECEERKSHDEYIAKLNKIVNNPEFSNVMQTIEHPVKTEAAVLKECKLLEEKKQYAAIPDLIEKEYPSDEQNKAPNSVLKFYERIISQLYERNGDNSFILRGLKYHKDSELLKKLLL